MHGIGVDDDLVGEPLHAAPVRLLVADELLAVGPVRIADRQAGRRVGVEHLLGGDDLDLVRVGVEPELGGDLGDRRVVALEQLEVPVGAVRDGSCCARSLRFLPEQLAEHRIDLRRAATRASSRSCRSLRRRARSRPTATTRARSIAGRRARGRRSSASPAGASRAGTALLAGSAPKASPSEACARRRSSRARSARCGSCPRARAPRTRPCRRERVSWKNVSSSTSSASSVWRMKTRSTSSYLRVRNR